MDKKKYEELSPVEQAKTTKERFELMQEATMLLGSMVIYMEAYGLPHIDIAQAVVDATVTLGGSSDDALKKLRADIPETEDARTVFDNIVKSLLAHRRDMAGGKGFFDPNMN